MNGISKRAYTDKELEEINNKTVTYNGKEIGEYEALKTQRTKEREIRQIKRELTGYQGIMLETENENLLEEARTRFNLSSNKLKNKEKELQNFIKQTGLKRNNERERIVQFNKSISQKVVNASKLIEKNKEILYNDITQLENSLSYIDLNTKKRMFIPQNTEITHIKDIAGGNSGKILRKAKRLEEKYGLKAENWIKRVGKIESDVYVFDIHWEEHTEGIKCNWKIKNYSLRGKDNK